MGNTEWSEHDAYWRANYRGRPYASSENQDYMFFQPAYRYGYDAANRYGDRSWSDIESNLATGWDSFEQRGSSTWAQVKAAVRDAWDRVTGHRPVGTH